MRVSIATVAVLVLGARAVAEPRATAGRVKVSGVSTPQPANNMAVLQAQGIKTLAQAEAEEAGQARVIYNDGSPRGSTADAFVTGAYVYKNDTDSGYGVFLNYEPQLGAYYPGAMFADEMILGNGFVAGGMITAYEVLIFRSTGDPTCATQLADFDVELWDGDPFDAIETTTAPHSMLATCSFTGVPCGVFWLHCDAKVIVPSDRVWIVLSGNYNCRTGWRISFLVPEVGSIYMGAEDIMELQQDKIAVPGTCCLDDVACQTAAAYPPQAPPVVACAGAPTGSREYCSDNFAENASLSWFGGPCAGLPSDSCASMVANIYAWTPTWMGVLPVGSDSAGAVIDFNTITLGDGDCNNKKVQFEMKVHGWDHDLSGAPKLKTWEIDIDDVGYAFDAVGKYGTLAYELQACNTSADCLTAWGGRCTVMGNACTSQAQCMVPIETCGGASCDYPTGCAPGACFCAPAYQLAGHPDQVLLKELPACDLTTPDFRCGSTLSPSGVPLPDAGKIYYGASLRMTTSDDVTGTAVVTTLPKSFMKDGDNNAIPLVGVVNAYVVCQIGQCCDLDIPDDPPGFPYEGCLADDVSQDQCALMATRYYWSPGKTCDDPCIECTGPTDRIPCADDDACTIDTCVDFFCVHTPITVPLAKCCDTVPVDLNADLDGLGRLAAFDGVVVSDWGAPVVEEFDPENPPTEPPIKEGEDADAQSFVGYSKVGNTGMWDSANNRYTVSNLDAFTLSGHTLIRVPNDANADLREHENGHDRLNKHEYEQRAQRKMQDALRGFCGSSFVGEGATDADRKTDAVNKALAEEAKLKDRAVDAILQQMDTLNALYDKLTDHGTSEEVDTAEGERLAKEEQGKAPKAGENPQEPEENGPIGGADEGTEMHFDDETQELSIGGDLRIDFVSNPSDSILERGELRVDPMVLIGLQENGTILLSDTRLQIVDSTNEDVLLDGFVFEVAYMPSNLPSYAGMIQAYLDIPPEWAGGIVNTIGSDFLAGMQGASNAGDLTTVWVHVDDPLFDENGQSLIPGIGVTGVLTMGVGGAGMPPDPPDVPPGEPGFDEVRDISFVPTNPGMQTALRVTLTDLPAPFEGDEDCKLWVGQPADVSEQSGSSGTTPTPTFKRSNLQTAWHCMDWGAVGTLHVTDNEIVPRAVYDVQAIDCIADPSNEANYSAPLTLAASKWGDIAGAGNNQPPNGVVDFVDISSVVDKFKNLPGAPIKSRVDIAPDVPDNVVDFDDIPSVVDAFRGLPYPYTGPDECP